MLGFLCIFTYLHNNYRQLRIKACKLTQKTAFTKSNFCRMGKRFNYTFIKFLNQLQSLSVSIYLRPSL